MTPRHDRVGTDRDDREPLGGFEEWRHTGLDRIELFQMEWTPSPLTQKQTRKADSARHHEYGTVSADHRGPGR